MTIHHPLPYVLTCGEPAGVGPDLIIALSLLEQDCPWFVLADEQLLLQRAQCLQQSIELIPFDPTQPMLPRKKGQIIYQSIPLAASVKPGVLNSANVDFVLDSLRLAVVHCQQQTALGMVTLPVQKSIIMDAGIPFSGQTEFVAQCVGVKKPVMMLLHAGMKVALVTTHVALKDVPKAITPSAIEETILVVHRDLRQRFKIVSPRIAVCGLNPHAGEGGHLGREEIDIIKPTLRDLKTQGIDVRGPFPADTLFTSTILKECDVVVAMYHDQGLPVLKYSGFGHAANVTLGLPIIRTSVDHGTALPLAGTGRSEAGSLLQALATTRVMSA